MALEIIAQSINSFLEKDANYSEVHSQRMSPLSFVQPLSHLQIKNMKTVFICILKLIQGL